VLCLGDAPIRRGGPPRHQTGLESTGKPAISTLFRASPRRPRAVVCRAGGCPFRAGVALLSRAGRSRVARPRRRTRAAGAFDATRCRASSSTPLQWSSRLQGFTPLTSPLRPIAVSSDASLVSPMGLVPLQGPAAPAFVRIRSGPKPGADRRVGSHWRTSGHPSPAFPARRVASVRAAVSLREFPAASRPSAEAATAGVALPAKSVRRQES